MMVLTRRQLGGLAAGAFITAGIGRASAQGVIKIGAVNPYSGAMAQYGDEVTRCFELGAEWVNAKGGVLGRQVQVVRGNATSAQEGIGAVEQLAGREKVDILVGTYVSAISNAASESALNYEKLYWETNALSRDLTDRGLPKLCPLRTKQQRIRLALSRGCTSDCRQATRKSSKGPQGLART
jgi:branched-chain amino acid transport system substrate-binding protein